MRITDAQDPEAAGAGEEDLGDEAVEEEDEENELADGGGELAPEGAAAEEDGGGEAQAEDEGDGGDGELAEDGGGLRDGLAAETDAGFDALLPGVDVVLILAGEELAHLRVDAVDIGGDGEDAEEEGEDEEGDGAHFVRTGFALSIRDVGRRSCLRRDCSRAAIWP